MSNVATEIFQELLKQVKDNCEKIHKYVEDGNVPRPWMIPKKLEGIFDPLDIEGMKKGFDRSDPNNKYIEEIEKDKSVLAKCSSYRMQMCYIIMMERAFRARHASFVRCSIHSVARRKGQGKEQGVHIRGVLNWANDLGNAK